MPSGEWTAYGHDAFGSRFSPLAQITRENVSQLAVAWTLSHPAVQVAIVGSRRSDHIEEAGTLEERRARNLRNEVLGIATSRMRRRMEAIAASDPETTALLERVVRRELDPATAASELLERQANE